MTDLAHRPSVTRDHLHRDVTARRVDRRRFLRAGALGIVGLAGGRLHAQRNPSITLPPYIADINGDALISAADTQVMHSAVFTNRGFGLTPNPGYDFRADVFGRGHVDQVAVDAVIHTIGQLGTNTTVAQPRPITVAWHYGWYDRTQRPLLEQTVRYLGGDYLSNDPVVEAEFNRLKNEFGITVDALSWIPNRVTPSILLNYRAGYFSAPNVGSRHVALLYENTLALPMVGGRIDFRSPEVSNILIDDFAAMAQTFLEAQRSPARIFQLDGRPVVFIFGSHSWGLNPNDDIEFDRIGEAVSAAREAFRAVWGNDPYLVGEELLPMASTRNPSRDRVNRTVNFDAIYTYHAANLKTSATPFGISEAYGALQRGRLARAFEAAHPLRNRFTGDRILIIPSLAGGFAKHGLPILNTTRQAYASYMKLLAQFYTDVYLPQEWPGLVGSKALPAPIYTVGSWNEEFEGHAVLPAAFNLALSQTDQGGFDFSAAIKQVFGWNHYAERSISGD